MARLILIITTVLMVVSIVLGFMNRQKFIEARTTKDDLNDQIQQAINDAQELTSKTEDIHDQANATEDERDVARVGIEETNTKITQVNAQVSNRESSIKEAENEIASMREKLAPFEGVTLENLNQKVEDYEREIADKEETIANLEKEIQTFQSVVDRNKQAIDGYVDSQSKRNSAITLNGTEATITAVNNDWGFVVVNAGSNRGVPSDARLLIKRGSENIGQLSIVSIEPSMLVANIVQESVKRGESVMPGDRVVFETNVN